MVVAPRETPRARSSPTKGPSVIKNDHPAAWQGIADSGNDGVGQAECAAALDALLRMLRATPDP